MSNTSETKARRGRMYLIHFFGTPANAQSGYGGDVDRAVDAAALLLAAHLRLKTSATSAMVRAWFSEASK